MIVMTDANKIAAPRQHPTFDHRCTHIGAVSIRQHEPVPVSGTVNCAPSSSENREMLALHGTSQDIGSIRVLLVILVLLVVAFWRTVLKIVIIFLLIAMLVLITSGAATLLHHIHHAIK
jgi:hypothetical protein